MDTTPDPAVAERLRQVRERLGLSLADVERKSGGTITAAALGAWERGDRNITATRMADLAELYGVPVADLFPPTTHLEPIERAGVTLDLAAVYATGGQWDGLRRWVDALSLQRRTTDTTTITLRESDLSAIAVVCGRRGADEVLEALRRDRLTR